MLKIIICLVIFIISIEFHKAADANIIKLEANNFNAELNKHRLMLVKFYVPWCPYCQKLKPELETAASMLSSEAPVIGFGEVNCDEEHYLCEQVNKIQGYPTLFLFKNGEFFKNYQGKNSGKVISKYMMRQKKNLS